MSVKWQKARLEDLAVFQRGFDINKAEQLPGKVPVVSSSGITSYHSEAKVKGPGVTVGRKGTLGTVFYVPCDYWPHSTSLWVKDFKGNNPRYVYYFLKTLGLEQFDVGVSNPTLNRNHIHGISIGIPPLPVQKKIASILSAYDDLIENNRRRIAILEEMTRKVYRKRFGSKKAKEVKKPLSELADVVMGQSPESSTYNEDGVGLPFHQGVTGFGVRYPTNEMWCTAGTRFAEAGDILFSVRAPVGRINVAREKIVIGRGLAAMRAKNGCQSWLLHTLKSHFSKEDMIGVGCIFASTTKKELFAVELSTPSQDEIVRFERIVAPIDEQIKVLADSSQALAAARDALLPNLMSGRIDVDGLEVG